MKMIIKIYVFYFLSIKHDHDINDYYIGNISKLEIVIHIIVFLLNNLLVIKKKKKKKMM